MGSKICMGNGQVAPAMIVEKPVPMPLSIQKALDSNGKLVNSGNSFMDLSKATDLGDYVLAYAYYNSENSGSIDLSSLETISGYYAGYYAFCNCTNLTGNLDLSNLKTIAINTNNPCNSMFMNTGITSVNLSGLTELSSGQYSCGNMFSSCTNLTTVDLSSLYRIQTTFGFMSGFSSCTNLTTVDLSSLTIIGNQQSCQNMFSNTNLKSLNLSSLLYIDGSQC